MGIKRKIGGILYYTLAKHLPRSYSGFRFGQTLLRRACGKLMLRHCGKKVNIEYNAVFSPKVSLGDYSGIGVNAKIYGSCTIGDYVMMGEDCTVITRNHRYDRTDIPMMHQGFEEEKPVTIGNDVWIGDRVTILPGVQIGDGCVIAAGAVVTKSIPPYAIAAGVPAKVIRFRREVE
ncbi:MAG: CatB-related O-acetyltransferase [Ruminococcaceae bacterium]|nr:CatB-related O-acetyltransferase [Oscillospiraceae bacterium]